MLHSLQLPCIDTAKTDVPSPDSFADAVTCIRGHGAPEDTLGSLLQARALQVVLTQLGNEFAGQFSKCS